MNMDNFEQKTKNLFEQYRPETDNDQIWNNIEPHLKKKKKRRFIIWFFVGAGLGLLGLLGLGGETKTTDATQASIGQSASDPAATSNAAPHAASDSEMQAPSEQASPANPDGALSVPQRKHKQARVMQISTPGTRTDAATAGSLTPKSTSVDLSPATASAVEPAAGMQVNAVADASALSAKADSNAMNQATALRKKNQSSGAKTAQKPQDKSKTHKRKKTRFEHDMSMQAGLFMPFKLLIDNPEIGSGAPELLAQRRNSERQLEAFNLGGMYTLVLRSGLLFRTGLEYRQMAEQFTVEEETVEVDYRQGIVSQTVDANGMVISQQMGLKKVTTTRYYRNIAYNKVQMLNLPIGVGYRMQRRQFALEWVGGLDMNLFFKVKGTMYDTYGYPSANSSKQAFRRRVGVGAWSMLMYAQPINRALDWQAGLNVQTTLGKVTESDYALNQRYINLGLQGGLLYKLNPMPIKGKSGRYLKKR